MFDLHQKCWALRPLALLTYNHVNVVGCRDQPERARPRHDRPGHGMTVQATDPGGTADVVVR
jgi:hypothetical protein